MSYYAYTKMCFHKIKTYRILFIYIEMASRDLKIVKFTYRK